jgi:hypothetical protein
MDKKLKSPKELFEEKQLLILDESEQKNQIKENLEFEKQYSKIISPKLFFGENIELCEEDGGVVEDNIYPEETYAKEDEENNVKSFLVYLFDNVNYLKENVETTKKYNKEIKFLKKHIKILENEILNDEEFDPSHLYESISNLKYEIQKVRSEIPEIPEPILYDDQLEDLKNIILNVKESIPIVPEIKYYDDDLNDLLESVQSIRTQVEEFPEVKYYDYQIKIVEDKIEKIKESIPVVPEIKYYDEDISYLSEKISHVKSSIPEIPEIKYYDNQIEDIECKIEELKTTIDSLPPLPEVKYYDDDINKLVENLSDIKNTIKNLPEPKYYEEELKLFDQKLESIKLLIPEPQTIPEIKYYDNEISDLRNDISLLSNKISSIKIPSTKKYDDRLDEFYSKFDKKNEELTQKIKCLEEIFEYFNNTQEEVLNESTVTEPPQTDNEDPLTPLNQQFVTFKQLQEHYQLFISRIQQQLSTLGGGGETQLKYLDDIVGISTNASFYDGKYLRYNHSIRKFEFSQVIGDGGEFEAKVTNLFDVDTSNLNNGYLMVYDQSSETFVFVNPQTYFGINADYNPDPSVADYGTY